MKTSGTNYIALSRSMGHLKHAIALRSFPAEYFAYFLFVSSAPSDIELRGVPIGI